MKKKILLTLIIILIIGIGLGIVLSSCNSSDKSSNHDDIKLLLENMTLEEKVGQMTQITLEVVIKKDEDGNILRPVQIDKKALNKALVDYKVGSVINTGGAANSREKWFEIISTIQNIAIEKTDKSIPILYGIDAIHGINYTKGATLFPQQLAQAATFNPEIVRRAAEITAYETRASGIPWTFSPVLGMGTQPLWPRFWETFGEDTYLTATLGESMIHGYQGESLSDTTRVAACMKHYLGYSHPETGKDRTPAWIPERNLRQYFLPPFATAVDAGVITTMVNSGEINGTPAHASKHILTDILKDELSYKGFSVTDWQDIIYLHTRHKIAPTIRDAIRISINAGIDMSMVPFKYQEFADNLIDLVKNGEVSEERIDDAVARILYVKKALNLWETPVTNYKGYKDFASKGFAEENLKAARESIILLSNKQNTLPLNSKTNLLVTGPTANSMVPLNGGWSYTWQGDKADDYAGDKNTVLEAIQNQFRNVSYTKGSSFHDEINIAEAVRKAKYVDAIILCLGESSYCETPGNIEDIDIPRSQEKLAKAMIETGKPVVLVMVEGRPRIISQFADDVDAILLANLPGNQGGKALAEIIAGKINPSGKLPYTYPRHSNHLVRYNHKGTQQLAKTDGSPEFNPQFEFGHGLSYTNFRYENLTLNKKDLDNNSKIIVQVNVTNTGDREGKESVLMYLTDHYASITPAMKELRGFEKITLKPGESSDVQFEITPNHLSFINKNLKRVAEPGLYTVSIGGLTKEFKLNE